MSGVIISSFLPSQQQHSSSGRNSSTTYPPPTTSRCPVNKTVSRGIRTGSKGSEAATSVWKVFAASCFGSWCVLMPDDFVRSGSWVVDLPFLVVSSCWCGLRRRSRGCFRTRFSRPPPRPPRMPACGRCVPCLLIQRRFYSNPAHTQQHRSAAWLLQICRSSCSSSIT